VDNLNEPMMRMGEHPSGACHASARGLAKLAAYMANRGQFNGNALMSEVLWEEFHSEPIVRVELPLGLRTAFTKGGVG
jgi:hypothetical protein